MFKSETIHTFASKKLNDYFGKYVFINTVVYITFKDFLP